MNVLIVDDEPLARERLLRLLEAEDSVTHCQGVAGGQEALQRLVREPADLVLLDIRMPGLDGLAVAEQLADQPRPPAIVFCTAHDDHALDAFRVQAVAYLLKPVRREDLAEALERAGRLNRAQVRALAEQEDGPILTFQTGRGRERIPLADLLYFRAEQKYVMAHCRQGERLCDLSLRQLAERWPRHLIRVHRHTLVPRQRLERLSRDAEGSYWLRLRGVEAALPVSRRFARELRPLFEGSVPSQK